MKLNQSKWTNARDCCHQKVFGYFTEEIYIDCSLRFLRQLFQGIHEREHVGFDALGISQDLFLRVQNLDALSVRIVSH